MFIATMALAQRAMVAGASLRERYEHQESEKIVLCVLDCEAQVSLGSFVCDEDNPGTYIAVVN
jgi:hypothetical protein